jgi:hypothetical protein
MLKRFLRRVVYFGIPVFMWVAGSACEDGAQQHQNVVHTAAYRCSRVGCDKRGQVATGAGTPVCSCGAPMVVDYTDDDRPRLRKNQ